MARQTIGIIVNGATGRIGSTQHLANALAPIIAEGAVFMTMEEAAREAQARTRQGETW